MMEFLDHTLVWDWCRRNAFVLDEGEAHVAPRLADDPTLVHRQRLMLSSAAAHAGAAPAGSIIRALGAWETCLVWATDWDVWVNEEDWPAYYHWRGEHGERRSVGAAPGHLFTASDVSDLRFLLEHVIRCSWDVTLLPTRAEIGRA